MGHRQRQDHDILIADPLEQTKDTAAAIALFDANGKGRLSCIWSNSNCRPMNTDVLLADIALNVSTV